VFCIAQNTFLLSYTNLFALIGEKNLGDAGWETRVLRLYGLIYCVAALVAIMISIPYWQATGLLR
jgi:hypothetical protein